MKKGPNKLSKKIIIILLVTLVIVIVAIAFGLSQIIKEHPKETPKTQTISNYTPQKPTPPILNIFNITNNSFSPNTKTIYTGTTVYWVNQKLTVCPLILNGTNNSFNFSINSLGNYSYKFDKSENYTFYCKDSFLIQGTLKILEKPIPVPKNNTIPLITADILQAILQKSPEMSKLSKDAKIIIQFHNNQKLFTGYIFFVGANGQVSAYQGQAYDFRITICTSTLSRLQSSANVCSDLKSIIGAGDAWVIEQPSSPFTLMKYMPIKSCVM